MTFLYLLAMLAVFQGILTLVDGIRAAKHMRNFRPAQARRDRVMVFCPCKGADAEFEIWGRACRKDVRYLRLLRLRRPIPGKLADEVDGCVDPGHGYHRLPVVRRRAVSSSHAPCLRIHCSGSPSMRSRSRNPGSASTPCRPSSRRRPCRATAGFISCVLRWPRFCISTI